MPLKSRYDEIPGGHRFFQPETGWDSFKVMPYPQWLTLRDAIIAMRRANPRFNLSTDPDKVEWEMDAQDTARLRSMPGTEHFLLPENNPSGAPPVFPKLHARAAAAVEGAGKVAIGIGVLTEWLGSGGEAVSKSKAEDRASICVECKYNKPGGLASFFTSAASEGIRKMLSIKNDLSLETSKDASLNVCSICLCPLKLKVWTPIEHISSNTSEATKADLPDWCWIKKELQLER